MVQGLGLRVTLRDLCKGPLKGSFEGVIRIIMRRGLYDEFKTEDTSKCKTAMRVP